MIRINLLKPVPVAPPALHSDQGSVWISRREVWTGFVLLLAAGTVLLYVAFSRREPEPAARQAVEAPVPAPPVLQPATPPPAAAPSGSVAPPPSSPPEAATIKPSPAPAPVAKPAPRAQGFRLTAISVRQQPEGLTVALSIEARASYRALEMKSPARLVVDVSDCRLAISPAQQSQAVDRPPVTRVRAGQLQIDPPVCRVVLDVSSFPRYEIRPGPDGLEIHIAGGKM